jgi:hypothetical protein
MATERANFIEHEVFRNLPKDASGKFIRPPDAIVQRLICLREYKWKLNKVTGDYGWKACVRCVTDGSMDHRSKTFYAETPDRFLLFMMASVGATQGEHILQGDVSRAYLKAISLDTKIVILIPTMFCGDGLEPEMLLWKALYGARSSALSWEVHINTLLLSLGYEKCHVCRSLYVKYDPETSEILHAIRHSDDLKFSSLDDQFLQAEAQELQKHIEIATFTPATLFVGAEFDRINDITGLPDLNGSILLVTQSAKIREMGTKFADVSRMFNPSQHKRTNFLPPQHKSLVALTPEQIRLLTTKELEVYMKINGYMTWVVGARPDGRYASYQHSSHLANATIHDFYNLVYSMDYLVATADMPLILGGPSIEPIAFADSSFNSEPNSRSMCCYFVCLGLGGAIMVGVLCPKTAHPSTMAAEATAMLTMCLAVLYLQNAMREQGYVINPTTQVWGDNSATNIWAMSQSSQAGAKHLDRAYDIVKQYTEAGRITVDHIATADNPADLLTKYLDFITFSRHQRRIMGHLLVDHRTVKGVLPHTPIDLPPIMSIQEHSEEYYTLDFPSIMAAFEHMVIPEGCPEAPEVFPEDMHHPELVALLFPEVPTSGPEFAGDVAGDGASQASSSPAPLPRYTRTTAAAHSATQPPLLTFPTTPHTPPMFLDNFDVVSSGADNSTRRQSLKRTHDRISPVVLAPQISSPALRPSSSSTITVRQPFRISSPPISSTLSQRAFRPRLYASQHIEFDGPQHPLVFDDMASIILSVGSDTATHIFRMLYMLLSLHSPSQEQIDTLACLQLLRPSDDLDVPNINGSEPFTIQERALVHMRDLGFPSTQGHLPTETSMLSAIRASRLQRDMDIDILDRSTPRFDSLSALQHHHGINLERSRDCLHKENVYLSGLLDGSIQLSGSSSSSSLTVSVSRMNVYVAPPVVCFAPPVAVHRAIISFTPSSGEGPDALHQQGNSVVREATIARALSPEEYTPEILDIVRLATLADQIAAGNYDNIMPCDLIDFPYQGRNDVRCRHEWLRLPEDTQFLLMMQMLADCPHLMTTDGEWFDPRCDHPPEELTEEELEEQAAQRADEVYMEVTFGFSSSLRFRDDPNDPRYLRDEDDC